MRVGLAWLKDYVDFDLDADALASRLTESLTESVAVGASLPGVTGVVVGRIVTASRHPDADNLKVCVVDWGGGSASVVCGAPNARPGLVTGLALPGAVIGGGRSIAEQTIRGVRSFGMLVSAAELGLSAAADGLIELDQALPLGTGLSEALRRGTGAVEIEVQPNRPDCTGVLGIAREVAAITGGPLREPAFELREGGTRIETLASVEVADPAGCPRYVARVVDGLVVGPSPPWLVERLESVGQRSINNVVDVTNFVMLEYGHPVHAFDLGTLEGSRIVVRRAAAGEEIETLDGVRRKLCASHLVIADATRPVAVAGVMGGADTEVSGGTRTVLLECAWFDPVTVRRGARSLGLRTEASWRFERGVDAAAMDRVAARACALIAQVAGGEVAAGSIDVGVRPPCGRTLELRCASVDRVLGAGVGAGEAARHLRSLGFGVEQAGDRLSVTVPTHRKDIEIEADLIEEVARARGYDTFSPEVPFHGLASSYEGRDPAERLVRDAMVGLGFQEVLTSSFTNAGTLERVGADPSRAVVLANPVNKELPLLRTTAVPALLDVVARNANVGEPDARIFEIAKVFESAGGRPSERWVLAGAMTGRAARAAWDGPGRPSDFYDGKGALWALGESLRVDSLGVGCYDGPLLDPVAGARLVVGGRDAGCFGVVSSAVRTAWDLEAPVFAFEIALGELSRASALVGSYEELPRFPRARRDMALVLDEGTPAGDVIDEVRAGGEALLSAVEVFDVYRGAQIPPGRKSLGLSLTYMSRERTLTDADVDEAHGRIVRRVLGRFGATLRG